MKETIIQQGNGIPVADLDVVAAIRQAEAERIRAAVAQKLDEKRKADERLRAHQEAVAAKIMQAAAERREAEAQRRRDAEEAHLRGAALKRFALAGGNPGDFEAIWPSMFKAHLQDKAAGLPGLAPDLERVWKPRF